MSVWKTQHHKICNVDYQLNPTIGEINGLSKSSSVNLKKCFPEGPQHSTPVGGDLNIDDEVGTLDRAGYLSAYSDACQSGYSKTLLGSEEVDMSYGTTNLEVEPTPPQVSDLNEPFISKETGVKEKLQGTKGSTISQSGMGPNVNVFPNDILEREMADIRPAAFTIEPLHTSMTYVEGADPSISVLDGESSPTADSGVSTSLPDIIGKLA